MQSPALTVVPDNTPAGPVDERPALTREERLAIAEYVATLEQNLATRDADGKGGTPSRNVIWETFRKCPHCEGPGQ